MYNHKRAKAQETSLAHNESKEGEAIEQKIHRMINNREPITDSMPLQYSERKDGVLPETNIRTDRMELAQDAMDIVSKSKLAKRESKLKAVKDDENTGDNPAGTQATAEK